MYIVAIAWLYVTLMMAFTIVIVLVALALFTHQQNARRELAFLAE